MAGKVVLTLFVVLLAPVAARADEVLACGSNGNTAILSAKLPDEAQLLFSKPTLNSFPRTERTDWLTELGSVLSQLSGDDFGAAFGFVPGIFSEQNPNPSAAALGPDRIVVSSGLLGLLDNHSEFAFVLAHEIAHVMLGHHHQEIDRSVAMQEQIDQEVEADLLAMQLLASGGFDPQSAKSVLAKISLFGSNYGLPLEKIYPSLKLRSAAIDRFLAQAS